MKILHTGFGFLPWRFGGQIEYVEDLMETQKMMGHDVYYFCSGRHYLYPKPKLLVWKSKKNFIVYELLNSPIYHGGDSGTIYDIESEIVENIFIKVLEEIKPDIIHIQELAGLPSSLIEIIKRKFEIPIVMTLHDYFLICPTLKLWDYEGKDCYETYVGDKCYMCCNKLSYNRFRLVANTLNYQVTKLPFIGNIYKLIFESTLREHVRRLFSKTVQPIKNQALITKKDDKSDFFQKRRDKNIERLKMIDILVSQSRKVEEIYKYFTNHKRIVTIHSTVKHLQSIKPKILQISYPIKFATLNGFTSVQKGALLLLNTIKRLENSSYKDRYEFHIYGEVERRIKKEILSIKNVFIHGRYNIYELDGILENIHVGVVPSVWQEVYGYVGLEFLAKGIPVIGNDKGGIPDYVIHGHTGWLNKSSSDLELFDIMTNIMDKPDIIVALNKVILDRRKEFIKSMKEYTNSIFKIYRQIGARS